MFFHFPIEKIQIDHEDIDAIAARGLCFSVQDDDGQPIGAYVLRPIGPELWISAAAGRSDIDLTAAMFALIESQAQAFDSIAFQTKRRGLVRKAQRHGYQVAGQRGDVYIMRKKK